MVDKVKRLLEQTTIKIQIIKEIYVIASKIKIAITYLI